MRNFIVILLLSTYVFSTTEMGQFLKVPILISHFVEHKEDNSKITFWGYLVHHYEGHEMDEDWETDMKLPFMQASDLLQVVVTPPSHFEKIPKKVNFFYTSKEKSFYQEKSMPSSRSVSIWQPPKNC